MKQFVIAFLVLLTFCHMNAYPQHVRKEYQYSYIQRFYFKLDKYNIDERMANNAAAVDSIIEKVNYLKRIGAEAIRIHVIGSASLEASEEYNARLAANRSDAFIAYLKRFSTINEDVDIHADYGVYDWNVLWNEVSKSDCPDKEALLRILEISNADISLTDRKKRILQLGDGMAYNYIKARYFHLMRYASIRVTADKMPQEAPAAEPAKEPALDPGTPYTSNETLQENPLKHPHIAIRTNMLMDLALMPNIGAEIYVTRNISVGANWMYSWWHSDKHNMYWRAYGGDIHADYWFRKEDTPYWHGHHAGIYANMQTFDFEWKGTGYQAPRWLWGGGISYGYAKSLNRHLSLDFAIGIGYLRGKFYKYVPGNEDDPDSKYYKTDTKMLNWFGPTKLEVSLVWKLFKD